MPVQKVKGGFKYGTKGKVYPTRAQAEKQGAAIRASQRSRGKKPH
jgi:tRNA splicing endonuclease